MNPRSEEKGLPKTASFRSPFFVKILPPRGEIKLCWVNAATCAVAAATAEARKDREMARVARWMAEGASASDDQRA